MIYSCISDSRSDRTKMVISLRAPLCQFCYLVHIASTNVLILVQSIPYSANVYPWAGAAVPAESTFTHLLSRRSNYYLQYLSSFRQKRQQSSIWLKQFRTFLVSYDLATQRYLSTSRYEQFVKDSISVMVFISQLFSAKDLSTSGRRNCTATFTLLNQKEACRQGADRGHHDSRRSASFLMWVVHVA